MKKYNKHIEELHKNPERIRRIPTLSSFAEKHCTYVDFNPENDYNKLVYDGYLKEMAKRQEPIAFDTFLDSQVSLPEFLTISKKNKQRRQQEQVDFDPFDISQPVAERSTEPKKPLTERLFDRNSNKMAFSFDRNAMNEAFALLNEYEQNNRTPPNDWTAAEKEFFKRFLQQVCENLQNPTFEHANQFKRAGKILPSYMGNAATVNYLSAEGIVSFAKRQRKKFNRYLKSRGVGLSDPYRKVRADYSNIDRAIDIFEQVYAGKTREQSTAALRALSHEDLLVLLKFMEHLCYEVHHGDAGKIDSGTLPVEKLLGEISQQSSDKYLEAGLDMLALYNSNNNTIHYEVKQYKSKEDKEEEEDEPPRPISAAQRCLAYGWHGLNDRERKTLLKQAEARMGKSMALYETNKQRMRNDGSYIKPYSGIPSRDQWERFSWTYLV